jgi:hypothetical protein
MPGVSTVSPAVPEDGDRITICGLFDK